MVYWHKSALGHAHFRKFVQRLQLPELNCTHTEGLINPKPVNEEPRTEGGRDSTRMMPFGCPLHQWAGLLVHWPGGKSLGHDEVALPPKAL